MNDTCCVQIGQCPEQRCDGRDGLARSEPPPSPQQLSQTAPADLVEDQSKPAISRRDGAVTPDQMLVPDPIVLGHLFKGELLRLRQVADRDDLENERVSVLAANRRPLRTERVRTHSAGGETRHERLQRDGSPYCLSMATGAPGILATSGGYLDHDRLRFQFADLLHYAVDL